MHFVAFILVVVLLWSGPVQAEPISATIGLTALISSLGVSAAVAGSIGGAIIGIGVSVGLNALVGALTPKPGEAAASTPAGVQSTLRVGAVTPRNMMAGRQMTAGSLAYWNLYGPDNKYLQLVFTLAAGPHDLFGGVIANGARVNLGAQDGTLGRPILEFDFAGNHTAWVQFYHGFVDQDADADLVNNAQPPGRWPAANRGRGVCYARVTLAYQPEVYPQGIPTFGFDICSRLYDMRQDSSVGGSGDHRWNDQSTWVVSDNPSLALYLFERGLYANGVKQVGRGLAPVDLVSDQFIAAANICAEAVLLKDATFEPRYRISMNVGADRDFVSVEQDFCTCFAGWIMDTAGAYGPIAGTARAPAFAFTTKDLVVGRPMSFSPKRSRSELVNAIYGSFSDPAQNYQPVPYPARRSSADAATDGGEFAAKHDYLMIFSGTQAQRVGEIERQLSRHQATASLTLGFKFSPAEQGDWCTWTDSPLGELTFQITRYQLDAGQAITLSLREISEAVFDFDPDIDELDPLNPGDLPGVGALISQPAEFSAEEITLNGPDGLKHPGIRTLWSPITDRTVDDVVVQYRLAAQPDDVSDAGPFPPEDGEGIISAGMQASGQYEVRASIKTTPVRLTTWTDWEPVQAGSQHVVPTALRLGAGGATWDSLAAEVRRRIAAGTAVSERAMRILASTQYQAKLADYERRLRSKTDIKDADERLGTRIEIVSNTVSDLDGEFAAYQILVAAQLDAITADVNFVLGAQATQEAAFAEFQLEATTQLGDLSSQVSTQGSSLSTLTESVAELESSVTASIGGLTSTVTTVQTALATINGKLVGMWGVKVNVNGHISGLQLISDGTASAFVVGADFFQVASPSINGGAGKVVYQIGTRLGTADVVMKGNMIVDGGIITASLSADAALYSRSAADTVSATFHNSASTLIGVVQRTISVVGNPLQIFAEVSGAVAGGNAWIGDSVSAFIYVDGAQSKLIVSAGASAQNAPLGVNGFIVHERIDLSPGEHTISIGAIITGASSVVGDPARNLTITGTLVLDEPRNPQGT